MKPDKGSWTDVLRRTLSETEEQLPQGGWERMERELGIVMPTVRKMPSKKIWINFAATAAVVLVCVSIGIRVFRNDKNVLKRVVMVSEAAVSEQNTDQGEAIATASDYMVALPEPLARVVRPLLRKVVIEKASIPVSQDETLFAAVMEYEPQAIANGASVETEQENSTSEPAASPTVSAYNTTDYDGLFAVVEPMRRRKTNVGVYAAGVVTSAGNSAINDYSIELLADNSGAASLRLPFEDYSYRHRQPLGAGLSFRKELGLGFSAETGLNYTLLRSEVFVPDAVINVKQRLHFVGVPLRANWEFVRAYGFSLYIGVGAKAELCVSARFGNEKIREDKVQWSVSGVLGAQYKLGKTVSIYFEPEVSHYLTHTQLQTLYTDSAVALNLRLGLRFNY